MEFALATLGRNVDLRCSVTEGGIRVRSRNGKLTNVIDAWSLGSEISCIGADEVVLNVDAITGDVGERSALTIDGGIGGAVRGRTGLQREQHQRVATVERQLLNLSRAHRVA